jgi:hypothetical protein
MKDVLKTCGEFLKSMAILNFSVCKGHAWFWSSRLCLSSFSGHCCEASAVKSAFDGQCLVKFFHIMSCVEKFIQRCLSLVHMFTIVFQSFLPDWQGAESPRPRLFKRNRPRIVRLQFISLKKTLLHMVRRALSSCTPNSIDTIFILGDGLIRLLLHWNPLLLRCEKSAPILLCSWIFLGWTKGGVPGGIQTRDCRTAPRRANHIATPHPAS